MRRTILGRHAAEGSCRAEKGATGLPRPWQFALTTIEYEWMFRFDSYGWPGDTAVYENERVLRDHHAEFGEERVARMYGSTTPWDKRYQGPWWTT